MAEKPTTPGSPSRIKTIFVLLRTVRQTNLKTDQTALRTNPLRHFFRKRAGWCGLTTYQIDGILGHQPEGMGVLRQEAGGQAGV